MRADWVRCSLEPLLSPTVRKRPNGTKAVRCVLRFVHTNFSAGARILKCIGRLPYLLDLKIDSKPIRTRDEELISAVYLSKVDTSIVQA